MDRNADGSLLRAQDLESRAEAGDVDAMLAYADLCAGGSVPKAGCGRALFWYEKAASLGSAEGMHRAGMLYDQGLGTPPSVQTALGLFRRAASLGHAGASYDLGRLLEQGRGREERPGEAVSAYFAASRLGHPRALVRVAQLHLTGAPGLAPNAGIARSCLEQAARLGDAEACAMLREVFGPKPSPAPARSQETSADPASGAEELYRTGLAFRDGTGREKDAARALEALLEAARLGHAGAQTALAALYLGESGLRDEQEAFFWYGKAWAQGAAEAALALGRMHAEGAGTPQDRAKALACYLAAADKGLAEGMREAARLVLACGAGQALPDGRTLSPDDACRLLERAAELGDAWAMHDLGKIYQAGRVRPGDQAKAAELFASAAALGLAEAQYSLALCAETGDGVPMDLEQACLWFRKAAGQGHAAAQSRLGQFLMEGWGCQADPAEAASWLEKAAEAGSLSAMNRLAHLCEKGLGLPADPGRALGLRRQAALKDFPGSALALARMRAEGAGAPRSLAWAFLWSRKELSLARAQGRDGKDAEEFIASLCAMLDEPDASSPEDEAELECRAGTGCMWARFFLSRRLWPGGDEASKKRAAGLLLDAAGQGLREAQEEAGKRYFAGDGLPQDDEKAGRWLKEALGAPHSLAGDMPEEELCLESCLAGEAPEDGPARQGGGESGCPEAAEPGPASGKAGGEPAEDGMLPQAGGRSASGAQSGAVPSSWRPLSRAAAKGQPDAQYKLALRLLEGRGCGKDEKKAADLLLRAALKGHAGAMLALGRLWARGPEGIRDAGRAKIWLAKAASCGRPEAETLLAEILLEEARGGDASARGAARERLKHACRAGEPGALYAMGCLLLDSPEEGRLLLFGPDQASALAKARECMAGAAARAHPEAALELAKLYLDGTGGKADAALASAWLKEAELRGAVLAGSRTFLELRRRIEAALPESELEKRREVLDIQAKAAGHVPDAVERLAAMTLEGDGVRQDFAEARRLFAEAAELGSETARGMADALNRSQAPHLQKRAEIDRRMAERGQGLAIENLAHAYEKGEGVPRNDRLAAGWLLKAALQGRAEAQLRLGTLFENGRGVPRDQTCAALWFAEAARGGLRAGQFAYALRLLEGGGVPEDPAEAFGWFEKAADQGSAYALDMMGHMLQEGRGVQADPGKAFVLFRKAADLGCDRSYLALGEALETGTGTPKDGEAAAHCYRMACQAGIGSACVRLAMLLDGGEAAGRPGEALELLQRAAGDKDCPGSVRAQALCRLGQMFRDGRGAACDPGRALDLLIEAAELGSAEARREAEGMLAARSGAGAGAGRPLPDGEPDEGDGEDGGMPALKAKAEAGDARSQCLLGARLYTGEGCGQDYGAAAFWFEKAALQGDTVAQNNLGWLYQRGLGVGKDPEKAFEWYLKAAEAGLADAQNSVGWMLGEGLGCEKDEKASLAWLRKAAEKGNAVGQYNLGFSLAEGLGCEPDEKSAVHWLEKAAAQGHARAQYMLALILKHPRGAEPDLRRAAGLVRTAAEQGALPEAMAAMGDMYRFGDGAEADFAKALEWYGKAAEHDDPNALLALAEMHAKGEGVARDVDKAAGYCARAAALGSASAQFQLGHMLYAPPEGKKQDVEQARTWLRKAAGQGHPAAQHLLSAIERAHGGAAEASRLLREAAEGGLADAQNELGWRLCGDGASEQDFAEAAFWFAKAGEQEHAEALFNLGALYSRGDGVPEDHAKAAECCLRAAELGYPAAQYVMGRFYAGGDGVEQNLDEAERWLRLAAGGGVEEAEQALVRVRSMQCDAVLAGGSGSSGGDNGEGGEKS